MNTLIRSRTIPLIPTSEHDWDLTAHSLRLKLSEVLHHWQEGAIVRAKGLPFATIQNVEGLFRIIREALDHPDSRFANVNNTTPEDDAVGDEDDAGGVH